MGPDDAPVFNRYYDVSEPGNFEGKSILHPTASVEERETTTARDAEADVVARRRYEDAVDEIEHLRLALKDAEKAMRRAEGVATEASEAAERDRERAEKAIAHLERLLEILS